MCEVWTNQAWGCSGILEQDWSKDHQSRNRYLHIGGLDQYLRRLDSELTSRRYEVKRDKEESDQKMDSHGLAGGNVFSRKIYWDRYFISFIFTCGSRALSRSRSFAAARFRLVMVKVKRDHVPFISLINEKLDRVSRVDPLANLVLRPLTCLYHPGLYSRQQVSLSYKPLNFSLTVLLYSRDRCCSVRLASPLPQNLSPSKNDSHNSFQVK